MAFQENLNASIHMFSFSEVMHQMFLTIRSAVQGSFRATLGVATVFVHVVLRLGWGAWRCPPPPRNPPPPPTPPLVLIGIKNNWYRTVTPQIRMVRSIHTP